MALHTVEGPLSWHSSVQIYLRRLYLLKSIELFADSVHHESLTL